MGAAPLHLYDLVAPADGFVHISRPPHTQPDKPMTLVDGGLPAPALDHDVFDGHGRFVARVDLRYPQWRIAFEFAISVVTRYLPNTGTTVTGDD